MPATASTQQTCTSVGSLGSSGALAKHQEFVSAGFRGLQVPGNVAPEGPFTGLETCMAFPLGAHRVFSQAHRCGG